MARTDNKRTLREFPVPQTFSAENVLLAALISCPSVIAEAKKVIRRETFADSKNGDLFELLVSMDDAGEEIAFDTVYTRTDIAHFANNIIPNMSGLIGFNETMDKVNTLLSLAAKRDIYFLALNLFEGSVDDTKPAVLVEKMREYIQKAGALTIDDGIRSASQVVNELGEELQKRQEDRETGKVLRVPTGFSDVDWVTYGGYAKGNLVILAARPSVGKTAFMLQMARAAAEQNIPALVMSLEMTNTDLVQRMASATGYVTTRDMVSGNIDWTAFEKATGKFSDAPLWFTDKVFRLDEIVSKVTTAHKQGRCDIVFIDYLGLITYSDKASSLYQQVTDCTKRLKRLAKELEIPVALLCQLNRDMSREGRAPELHDLRDSGSIEQDADIVLMLARNIDDPEAFTDMYVRKNRQGQTGGCFTYKGENGYTLFRPVSATEQGEVIATNVKQVPHEEEEELELPYYQR